MEILAKDGSVYTLKVTDQDQMKAEVTTPQGKVVELWLDVESLDELKLKAGPVTEGGFWVFSRPDDGDSAVEIYLEEGSVYIFPDGEDIYES